MVIAIIGDVPLTLIEPRRLRAEFLRHAIDQLSLTRVTVEQKKVEQVSGRYDHITARAVARLGKLFAMANHLAHDGTRWVLP